MCSFAITVFSEIFIDKFQQNQNDLAIYVIVNIIARFLYGYSCVRVITRKYIMLYIPESEIKYYSLIYIIISYLGLLCGVILNILINDKEPSITISKKLSSSNGWLLLFLNHLVILSLMFLYVKN